MNRFIGGLSYSRVGIGPLEDLLESENKKGIFPQHNNDRAMVRKKRYILNRRGRIWKSVTICHSRIASTSLRRRATNLVNNVIVVSEKYPIYYS